MTHNPRKQLEIVFHKEHSTIQDQSLLWSKLPLQHEFGDICTKLEDKTILRTQEEHDAYCDPALRIKTRKRCTIVKDVQLLNAPSIVSCLMCFLCTPDWSAKRLDVEQYFLRQPQDVPHYLPKLGSCMFDFVEYFKQTFEDLVMGLEALRSQCENQAPEANTKYHLKIVPIGIGHGIKTFDGQHIYDSIVALYMFALIQACKMVLHESWVHTVEFVDHTGGYLSPYFTSTSFNVILRSKISVLDYSHAVGPAALFCPCDAFERIGSISSSKSLACSIANQTNLRHILANQNPEYKPWPF